MSKEMMPTEPEYDAPLDEKVAWLLYTHGFCERLDKVVMLYEPSDQCLLMPQAFHRSRKPWRESYTGPRDGEHIDYASKVWESHKDRPNIQGIRMRPDQPFPTYREGRALFKNTYQRPVHVGEGDLQLWRELMQHLLPVEFEREWFLDWLAHKWVKPAIPGVAVIMVAADIEGQVFGTGRGMLRDIIQRLLGRAYVRPIDFDILSGRSAQAVYTDWLAGSILAAVDEAKDSVDAGKWSQRRAVYEWLKAMIDPRAVERSFIVKGGQMFFGLCFCGFLISTNNLDAIQLPPGDRRFAVLANGGRMTGEMAKKLQAWMEQPGNIAALARWLEERARTSKFDPFEAPETLTKAAMQELARSERDEAFLTVRRRLGRRALFIGAQIHAAMAQEVSDDVARKEDFAPWVRQRLRAAATAVTGADFRLPPAASDGRRARILRWRDYDGPVVKDLQAAQEQVALSQKVIDAESDAKAARLRAAHEEMAARLQALRVIQGGAE